MPKYGIHSIVLNEAIKKMADPSSSQGEKDLAQILNENREYANLGAIGPDIFFWAPDYDEIDKLFTLYENLKKIIDIYNKIVAPVRAIKDAVGDAAEEVVGSLAPNTVNLIRSTIEEIRETGKLLKSAIATNLFAGVIGISDTFAEAAKIPTLTHTLFSSFAPALQFQLNNGQQLDEKEWYWFDLLHYRRTGVFASHLVNNDGSLKQKAYAYGYLSHIATDVVGHAFVNQVVGGPYRLNVQKHVMVENYMDTWAFLTYHETNINKTLFDKIPLPDPENLSGEIIDQLDNTFRNTFNNLFPTLLRDPGYMTKDEIRNTYARFYTILDFTNNFYMDRPEEPFSNVLDILHDALEDLMESPPSPPSPDPDLETCSWGEILSLGLSEDSRDCYKNFFEEAGKYFEYLGELLIWTFETLLDLIDLLLASLLSIPVIILLAILYGIQLLAYQALQNAKAMLAEAGFITPEPDLLNTSVGLASTTTFFNCSTPFKYPNMKPSLISHLVCPLSQPEVPTTAADFNLASREITSKHFMENIPFNRDNLNAYATSDNPDLTRQHERNQKQISNAVDFTKWMIVNGSNSDLPQSEKDIVFTDWNLDSDRGYGYKNWEGKLNSDDFRIEDEKYTT